MKIAVVGAGISGLTCAFRLQQQGHDVRVFEAERTLGGRMSTTHVEGFPIDTGANLLLANYARLYALAEELGIGDRLFEFESGSGGILRDHELNSFTPSNAFDLSAGEDPDADENAYLKTAERLGVEVADYVIDPFVRTFHFHGARQMSMKYFDALVALFVGTDNFRPSGFTGFMQMLPRALGERLDVRTASPVSLVRPGPDGVGVQVDGEQFEAAVLAVPAPIALAMLAPPSREQLAVLSATTYAPTISVAFRCPRSIAEDFEGIWIPYHESRLISGCSNDTCKGAFTETECVFTFGMHSEAASARLERPDEEIFETIASEWSRLFPRYRGALRGLHLKRWPLAMPIYGPGQVERVRDFWHRGQGDGHVYLCGDYLNHPWVEGSIRCGEKVAAMIAEAESAVQ